jgi:hypothetical protein
MTTTGSRRTDGIRRRITASPIRKFAWGRVVLDKLALDGNERVIDSRMRGRQADRGEVSARSASRRAGGARCVAADAWGCAGHTSPIAGRRSFRTERCQRFRSRAGRTSSSVPPLSTGSAITGAVHQHPQALKRGGVLHAQCGGGQNLAQRGRRRKRSCGCRICAMVCRLGADLGVRGSPRDRGPTASAGSRTIDSPISKPPR